MRLEAASLLKIKDFKFVYKGISYVYTLSDKIPKPIVAVIVHWIVFIGLFFM